MKIRADGAYVVDDPAELELLAGTCEILDNELLAGFPPDVPISDALLEALCREARRRYRQRKHPPV